MSVLNLLEKIDDIVDNRENRIPIIQQKIFMRVKLYLQKNLDTDKDGNIKRTTKNLRVIRKMKLRNMIVSDDYRKDIKKYIQAFDVVAKETKKEVGTP